MKRNLWSKVVLSILILTFIISAYLGKDQFIKDVLQTLVPTPTLTPTATPIPTHIPNVSVLPQSVEQVIVARVIDGDTIELQDGRKLRYIGIDTPETVDPRRGVQCFGKEASEKNKELVLNKEVRLEKDISETDRFGRLLRYVYVDDVMVNELLVRDGFAYSSSYPPDIKYQEKFMVAEKQARDGKKGLWNVCSISL